MTPPTRTPTTQAMLELADRWAIGSAAVALEMIATGKAETMDLLGTTFRSMFMLGANVALGIAAIDPEAGVSIRASIVTQMEANGIAAGVDTNANELANLINHYAAEIVDIHRREG